MQTARVLGNARATVKHESLVGRRLVVAQPLALAGEPDGPPLLILDNLGCRRGDLVIITSDGSAVTELTGSDVCPARWSVCGLVD